ncbi:hypothetical protein COCNU_15G002690 [Cocos nucifera]|uniref:Uncharacterized protein n=1 Tax=Cocos nucifera TaxID=13894 RepID=A0A8K0IX43_COCNU|nr:hypothetical protein COCNU_15G002690 [Cocos nucifera]
MGVICSKGAAVDKSPSESTLNANGLRDDDMVDYEPYGREKSSLKAVPVAETMGKGLHEQPYSVPKGPKEPKEPQLSRVLSLKSKSTKSKPVASGKITTTKASPFLDSFLAF